MTGNAFDSTDGPGTLRLERTTDGVVSLCLVGEFDMGNAGSISDEGQQALLVGNHVILDLSETTFIDSSAIAALLTVSRRARKSRRAAVLQVGTPAIVETVLEFHCIERALPRVETRPEALSLIRLLDGDDGQPS